MNDVFLDALGDELKKSAGLGDAWRNLTDLFRGERGKAKKRVEYHFSPKVGKEKWDRFSKRVGSKEFVNQLSKHPEADAKLIMHAASLHDLSKGKVVGKVGSSGGKGKTYEIRRLSDGRLGCTCGDWKYKGSVDPSHKCKHIRAFEEGKTKVASFKDSTRAFFDELDQISERERRGRERQIDKNTERPFSSLLTQDEEPTDYQPNRYEESEPEMIVGLR